VTEPQAPNRCAPSHERWRRAFDHADLCRRPLAAMEVTYIVPTDQVCVILQRVLPERLLYTYG
jgi:hypothetical protein